jgi:hypothetical protein
VIKISSYDMETLLYCAFSYAVGRSTYIVSDVADIASRVFGRLDPRGQEAVYQDLRRAVENAGIHLGHKMDQDRWFGLLNMMGEKLGGDAE